MAAPPDVTIEKLSGKFVMNKKLSDDPDAMLTLQGIGWLTRKAISLATVVLTIKEYTKDNVIHIDITQVASNVSTTQEDRILNWSVNDHDDRIFGKLKGQSRMFKIEDFEMVGGGPAGDAAFLKAEKLKDGKTDSKFLEALHVQSWVVSQGGGWTAEQIWGFEEIDGKRYYTRRVVVRKGDKAEYGRLVYDFKNKLEGAEEDDGLAYGEE